MTITTLLLASAVMATEVSYYSYGYRTASGELFNKNAMTAAVVRAHNSLRPSIPFGSLVKVSYKGKSVVVRITDTGSYKPRRAKMWLDLTPAAFRQLAPLKTGRIVAKYEIVKLGKRRGKNR